MRFNLQSDDLLRLQRHALQRALPKMPKRSAVFAVRVALWFCVAFTSFRLYKAHECCSATQPFIEQAGLFAFAAVLLFFASQHIFQSAYIRQAVQPGGWFLSEQEVVVTPEGLQHNSRLGQSSMPWTAFLWRTEDERNFYLYIDEGIGFVYPKSAIAEPEHQALLRERIAGEA